MNDMDKKQIRQFVMKLRSALSTYEREAHSEAILMNLLSTDYYKEAKHVASFVDFRDEVYMSPINHHILESEKSLYLPYVDMKEKRMTFHRVTDLSDLTLSKYGILEPNPQMHPEVDIQCFDLVLTPGVAFDHTGHRLGYGGGFYDRFFQALSSDVPRLGIAFSIQQLDLLPLEPHDLPLTGLITENGLQLY